jgi:acetyl esterase
MRGAIAMVVNQSEQKFFEHLAQLEAQHPSKPFDQQTVEEFRQGADFLAEFAGNTEEVVIENKFISARDGHKIPIRIFNADITMPGPVFIMFPGGGYIMDTFEANAVIASRMAKYSGTKIILVNNRLIPEHPMPVPIYDALDAVIYISQHAHEFNLDPERLVIGGLSSGAHCAAVVSTLAQKIDNIHIKHQILLNGAYDDLLTKRPHADYEKHDLMVDREAIVYIYKLWEKMGAELNNPLYSPYYADDVTKLPETTIIVGEFDGMRSDSEKYFEKLKDHKTKVSRIVLKGQCHHTVLLRGAITDVEDPAKVMADVLLGKHL